MTRPRAPMTSPAKPMMRASATRRRCHQGRVSVRSNARLRLLDTAIMPLEATQMVTRRPSDSLPPLPRAAISSSVRLSSSVTCWLGERWPISQNRFQRTPSPQRLEEAERGVREEGKGKDREQEVIGQLGAAPGDLVLAELAP